MLLVYVTINSCKNCKISVFYLDTYRLTSEQICTFPSLYHGERIVPKIAPVKKKLQKFLWAELWFALYIHMHSTIILVKYNFILLRIQQFFYWTFVTPNFYEMIILLFLSESPFSLSSLVFVPSDVDTLCSIAVFI